MTKSIDFCLVNGRRFCIDQVKSIAHGIVSVVALQAGEGQTEITSHKTLGYTLRSLWAGSTDFQLVPRLRSNRHTLRILVMFCMHIHISGTPRYSDRLCSVRHYSDNPQSGRRRRVADCSWIGLRAVSIGKTSNQVQIPKIRGRGSTIVLEPWRYIVTFLEKGARQTSPEYPPHSPRSPRCLDQWHAFDASDTLTPSNFVPISTIPTYAEAC